MSGKAAAVGLGAVAAIILVVASAVGGWSDILLLLVGAGVAAVLGPLIATWIILSRETRRRRNTLRGSVVLDTGSEVFVVSIWVGTAGESAIYRPQQLQWPPQARNSLAGPGTAGGHELIAFNPH
jgi:ABC-type Fe3+-siderophore transport system permease subunit